MRLESWSLIALLLNSQNYLFSYARICHSPMLFLLSNLKRPLACPLCNTDSSLSLGSSSRAAPCIKTLLHSSFPSLTIVALIFPGLPTLLKWIDSPPSPWFVLFLCFLGKKMDPLSPPLPPPFLLFFLLLSSPPSVYLLTRTCL